MVHEYQKWYMQKQEKYQKWYMKNNLNTKSGIRIPKMVYAKAEEIPEMVHIYYGIKTKQCIRKVRNCGGKNGKAETFPSSRRCSGDDK